MKHKHRLNASKSSDAVALAVALVGCPARDADAESWLEAETLQRVAEAKMLGASDIEALEWARLWRRFARLLVDASR